MHHMVDLRFICLTHLSKTCGSAAFASGRRSRSNLKILRHDIKAGIDSRHCISPSKDLLPLAPSFACLQGVSDGLAARRARRAFRARDRMLHWLEGGEFSDHGQRRLPGIPLPADTRFLDLGEPDPMILIGLEFVLCVPPHVHDSVRWSRHSASVAAAAPHFPPIGGIPLIPWQRGHVASRRARKPFRGRRVGYAIAWRMEYCIYII